MSFYVNNIELKEAYFNGSSLNTIYYNGTKVWDSWPGLAKADWDDIYKLCKDKQNGVRTEWPEDIVVGAHTNKGIRFAPRKDDPYNSEIGYWDCYRDFGGSTIVGIDEDGDGVLTFRADYVVGTSGMTSPINVFTLDNRQLLGQLNPSLPTYYGKGSNNKDGADYSRSIRKGQCETIFDALSEPLKSSIKPLEKEYTIYLASDPNRFEISTITSKLWIPSTSELNLQQRDKNPLGTKDRPESKPYSYFDTGDDLALLKDRLAMKVPKNVMATKYNSGSEILYPGIINQEYAFAYWTRSGVYYTTIENTDFDNVVRVMGKPYDPEWGDRDQVSYDNLQDVEKSYSSGSMPLFFAIG